jgi:hypothetical protein
MTVRDIFVSLSTTRHQIGGGAKLTLGGAAANAGRSSLGGHVLTKFGFLGPQPVGASPAPVEAALSLRHDALKAELAGFGEHDLALAKT